MNDDLKNRLKSVGLKATPSRLALLDLLVKNHKPLSIRDILKKIGQKADQATVYRMLESFKNAGLARQVDFQQDFAYFEIADEHDHHHIVCRACGRIEDFIGCDFEKLAQKALKQTKKFSAIDQHSFEMFGICNSCTK